MTTFKGICIPPPKVSENARKGLLLRKQFGRGGTQIGVSIANQLKEGEPVEPSIVLRMSSYFARHEVDKRSKNFGNEYNPSAGYVAWLLWGGDEGKQWSDQLKQGWKK